MRARVRRFIAAALLLVVPVASPWLISPAAAQARATALDVDALQVNANNGLAPGSTLQFTVRGTPAAQARVQLQGSGVSLTLREGAPGVYSGSYTIRPGDRINPANLIRASLALGSQTAVANYSFPPAFMALATNPAPRQPQAQPQPQPQAPAQAQALRIDRFAVAPAGKVAPGTELRFSLDGAPGASASVEIPGIDNRVPLREVQPGTYVGSYTLRRDDKPGPGRATATLRAGDRWMSARLPEPIVIDDAGPVIGTRPPAPNAPGSSAGTTVVFGTFDDGGGSGVDPQSVRLTIAGRDVTADTKVTPHSFSYRGLLPPGRHTVEVSARDLAGNASRDAWIIDVGTAMGAAPATALPLQVVSPGNRGGSQGGDVVIDGRTAPGASVRVQVDAIAPPVANRATVAQTVNQQTVTADRDGNFSVNLGSYRAVMGTRFEVLLVATQGGLSAEQRLVLGPRPG